MDFIDWLFGSPTGVAILVFGGMLLFIIIAFIAERRTHKRSARTTGKTMTTTGTTTMTTMTTISPSR